MQALGELFVVLTRAGASREEARESVPRLHGALGSAASGEGTLPSALDAAAHRPQVWDALILRAAAEAGCALVLSEDMHPGFAWRGVVVANPFAKARDARLDGLLGWARGEPTARVAPPAPQRVRQWFRYDACYATGGLAWGAFYFEAQQDDVSGSRLKDALPCSFTR